MQLFAFITSLFVSKRTWLLTAAVCWPPDKTRWLSAAAAARGLRVRVVAEAARLPAAGLYREGVVIDIDCPHAARVLRQASESRAFVRRYSWLLLSAAAFNESSVRAALAGVHVLPDADVTWAAPDVAADLYRLTGTHPLILTRLDLRRSDNVERMEAMWNNLPTAVTRRRDLQNIYIDAATIVTQPQHFKGWSDLSDRQIDTYPKLTYPLMMLLGEDLHFRYNMRQVDLYGEARNGSFDGLAGLLQRGEVELGVASMFMRADRWPALAYCAETIALSGSFIFRQPPQSAVSNVFLLPFSGGVWAAGCGLAALAAALLAALSRTLRHSHPDLAPLTTAECFTFAVGTVCQQGFHTWPGALSARVLMWSTLVWALFLFTAYGAKVVAILQAPSAAIQTLDDLAASPMTMAVQETTYKRVYFAESREPATQRLYRRKLLPLGEHAYLSVVDGVARLRTGLFAFQVEESSGFAVISRTFTEREKCSLHRVRAFQLPMVAVPARKHSALTDLVAARIRWQRETGLMDRARRVWLAPPPRCEGGAADFISIGLTDVLPALQVLACGAATAAALLGAELLHARAARARLPRLCCTN